jgi:RNA polymerase sigma-70 factor (ECF subfamily)
MESHPHVPPAQHTSDEAPVVPIANGLTGPPRDFHEVALPLLDDVTRFARWLTRDEAEAEDLVQDTFLRACRFWPTFKAGSNCRNWLFTICRNRFLDTRRRVDVVEAVDDEKLDDLAAAAGHEALMEVELAERFDRLDLREAVRRELLTLSETYREVVVLIDLEGLKYHQAAEVLGVPIGTVRSRLFRARGVLQGRLAAVAREAGFTIPPAADTPVTETHR